MNFKVLVHHVTSRLHKVKNKQRLKSIYSNNETHNALHINSIPCETATCNFCYCCAELQLGSWPPHLRGF